MTRDKRGIKDKFRGGKVLRGVEDLFYLLFIRLNVQGRESNPSICLSPFFVGY